MVRLMERRANWETSGTNVREEFKKAMNELQHERPARVLRLLKDVGIRNHLDAERIPLTATLYGHEGMSAREVLIALRKQYQELVGGEDTYLRRRLRYFFQLQLLPRETRYAFTKYMPITYIPGGDRYAFPEYTSLWDLDRLEMLCFGLRLNRMVKRIDKDNKPVEYPVDHTDVRVLLFEMDRSSGVIKLGGTGLRSDASQFSRCILSRFFTFEPGCDPMALPGDRDNIIDQGLSLHESMEMNLATNDFIGQLAPILPKLYLGFKDVSGFDNEYTDELKNTAYQNVTDWLRNGMPISPEVPEYHWAQNVSNHFCDKLIGYDPDKLSGWSDVEKIVGPIESKELLDDVWQYTQRRFEGLTVIPSSFFQLDSLQEPYGQAERILADMRPFLGRKRPSVDGIRDVEDMTQAKVQVLELIEPEKPPFGNLGKNYDYDFTTVEVNMENMFK